MSLLPSIAPRRGVPLVSALALAVMVVTPGSSADTFPPGKIYAFATLKLDSGRVEGLFSMTLAPNTWNRLADFKDCPCRVSPDGKRIAFTRFDSRPEGQILSRPSGTFLLDLEGGGEARKISEQGGYPSWGPGGRWLVISTWAVKPGEAPPRETWRINADGSDPRRLPTHETDRVSDVSPDGKRLVAVSGRHAKEGTPASLYVMNLDGSDPRRLTRAPRFDDHPRFSPDGSRVVYVHSEKRGDVTARSVRIVPVDGGEARTILDVLDAEYVDGPCWSPDGKALASRVVTYAIGPDGKKFWPSPDPDKVRIVVLDPDGRDLRSVPLPPTFLLGEPDWR